MNFKKDIPKVKKGINVLIKEMGDGVRGGKTKTILESQKDAFINASRLTIDLYYFEDSETDGYPDVDWYISTIESIIEKGSDVIKLLFDGIASPITSDNQNERKSDIAAKPMAFGNIKEIKQKLDELKEILDKGKEHKRISITDSSSNFCAKWAKKLNE